MEREKPRPEPASPFTPLEDVHVAASRCPFCHTQVAPDGRDWSACAACLARHHDACWGEARRCAACGHTARLEPPRRGSRPRALFVLTALSWLLATAALVAWASARREAAWREKVSLSHVYRGDQLTGLLAEETAAREASQRLAAEAEARACAAELRAGEAAARLRRAEEEAEPLRAAARLADERAAKALAELARLRAEQAAAGPAPAQSPAWDRGLAHARALAVIARADVTDPAERRRLDGARDVLVERMRPAPPGPPGPESILEEREDMLMFASAAHPQFEEMSSKLLALLLRTPDEPRVRACLAHVRVMRGDAARGLEDASAALDRDPACWLAWIARAQARTQLGQRDAARQDFFIAEALHDGWSAWPLLGQAELAVQAGDLVEARRCLRLILDLRLGGGLGMREHVELRLAAVETTLRGR